MSSLTPGAFKLPYNGKYRKSSPFDFPKLSFQKKDDKAVIMLVDPVPTVAYVHWVVLGVKQDTKTQTKQAKGGYFLCMGNPEKLLSEERDDAGCPFCKVAEDTDGAPVGLPRFKAATHVVQYATTPQGALSVIQGYPPQFWLKIWTFGQQTYNSLVDKQEIWGENAYRVHDLLLTCTNSQYQNVTLDVLPASVWMDARWTQFGTDKKPSAGLAIQVAQMYTQTRLKDMAPLLGKVASSAEDACKHILAARKFADELGGVEVTAGMLPSQVEAAVNAHGATSIPPMAVNIDDLFGGHEMPQTEVVPSSVEAAAPAAVPVAAQPALQENKAVVLPPAGADSLDFEALLKG